MKTMRKKSFKIVIVLTVFLIITYTYLLSDFNVMFSNEKYVQIEDKIENLKEDNELASIVSVYNKIHKANTKSCPCERATYYIDRYNVFKPSFSRTIYSLKLHNDYDEDHCLKFLLLHNDFLHGVVGVKEASKYYYKKSLSQISEEEIITLIVMFENPSLYNPYRAKEMIQKKVKQYQNFINKQNGS